MKTLLESIFDDDLATKELDVEKISKNFDNKSLQSLKSTWDIKDQMDAIINVGEECTFDQLKKKNIDLSKNIVVQRKEKDYRMINYSFVFVHQFYNALERINGDCLLIGTFFGRNQWKPRDYKWEFNVWDWNVTVESAWDEYIKTVKTCYIDHGVGPDLKFYILPKNISENIIKCMLKK